jgi:phosphotransferase system HPr (HPr) family protein
VKSKKVTVLCEEGLHLRVASKVASIAQKAGGSVKIRSKNDRPFANACSVLELLTLGATLGTPLEIVAEGPNEDGVLNELSEVFKPCGDL